MPLLEAAAPKFVSDVCNVNDLPYAAIPIINLCFGTPPSNHIFTEKFCNRKSIKYNALLYTVYKERKGRALYMYLTKLIFKHSRNYIK